LHQIAQIAAPVAKYARSLYLFGCNTSSCCDTPAKASQSWKVLRSQLPWTTTEVEPEQAKKDEAAAVPPTATTTVSPTATAGGWDDTDDTTNDWGASKNGPMDDWGATSSEDDWDSPLDLGGGASTNPSAAASGSSGVGAGGSLSDEIEMLLSMRDTSKTQLVRRMPLIYYIASSLTLSLHFRCKF
jgi:hypothetical protein